MEAEFHLPCSQLLNLIFRSHKMKLSLIQKKGIQHIPIEKDTFNQSLGLRGIRVLETTSRREETNEIIKTTLLLVGIKNFFGQNEKIFYRETLLPYV